MLDAAEIVVKYSCLCLPPGHGIPPRYFVGMIFEIGIGGVEGHVHNPISALPLGIQCLA